jgi:uncharacterized membrane protein YkoI
MRTSFVAGSVILVGVTAAAAFTQVRRDAAEDLQARATYSQQGALQQAQQLVPGGRLIESELEEEDGRLIYGFEFETADGITEVEIDAVTGELIEVEHEDDDEEDDDDDGEDDEDN